jgi:hypothetical protein
MPLKDRIPGATSYNYLLRFLTAAIMLFTATQLIQPRR